MAVNITPDVIFGGFFTLAQFYGLFVSANQLRKGFDYRFFRFAVMGFIFNGIGGGLLPVLGTLFLSTTLFEAGLLVSVFSALFTLLKVETLKNERGEPVKLSIIVILITLFIVSLFAVPDAARQQSYPGGVEGIAMHPVTGALIAGALIISFSYYFACTYMVSKQAPAALKRHARIFAAGVFLIVIGLAAIVVAQPFLPGVAFLVMGTGAIMDVYAYGHEPKLIFILPFKALRLTVLETESGLPLFTHTWNQQDTLAGEDLFSGMLQGVNMIVRESLQRGNMQEIHAEGAIIIAYRVPGYPVACMLVATRPTRSLRDGLKLFAERFCARFEGGFATPTDVGQFEGAEEIVAACFPYVPVYR